MDRPCSTFNDLLERLAATHRTEIEAAVSSLSRENHALRTQLDTQRAKITEQPPIPCERAADSIDGRRVSRHSRNSSDSGYAVRLAPSEPERRVSITSRFQLASKQVSVKSSEFCSSLSSRRDSKVSSATRDVMKRKRDQINKLESTKLLRRLQWTLCEEGHLPCQPLRPEIVLEALRQKGAHFYNLESITQLLCDLRGIAEHCTSRDDVTATTCPASTETCISLEGLVNLFMLRDPLDEIDEDLAAQLAKLQSLLVAEDLVETIKRLSTLPELEARDGKDDKFAERIRQINMLHNETTKKMPAQLAKILNTVVGLCVLASIILAGVSLDNDPDHPMWLWIEAFFASVFVIEIALKLHYFGWRRYFVGADCGFNWLDLVVTVLAATDLLLSTMVRFQEASAFNMAMVLKSFRLFRFVRLMKLFHTSPILKQLVAMMSGFVIGAPSLMWILIIIIMFIYFVAIGFRSFFLVKNNYHELSPEELVQRCGHGDFVVVDMHGTPKDPACMLYLLYGDEFFGSVPRSMITVFRFMIGDTATTSGKSLVQALDTTHQQDDNGERNLAVPFYFFYIPFMIIVIFGIFNIITAVFVETTINGLKHSDNIVRRRRYYESHYVQGKVEELAEHIQGLKSENHADGSAQAGADVEIDQTTFHELMENHTVKALLRDLDIVVDETLCHFDMFDLEGIGQITLPHFLGTLMRLRGEPHKIDVVSSWSSLRTLQKSFHEFQHIVLEALHELTIEHGKIDQRLSGIGMSTAGSPRLSKSL